MPPTQNLFSRPRRASAVCPITLAGLAFMALVCLGLWGCFGGRSYADMEVMSDCEAPVRRQAKIGYEIGRAHV